MTYSQIWRDIKAAKHEPTTRELLDIVQALRGKFQHDDRRALPEALHDCAISLQDTLSDEGKEDEAADWLAERRNYGNRAELDAQTPRASGSVLGFISTGATA